MGSLKWAIVSSPQIVDFFFVICRFEMLNKLGLLLLSLLVSNSMGTLAINPQFNFD